MSRMHPKKGVLELVESWHRVMKAKGAPWAELEERKCGWWVELPALDKALREACGAAGVRALPEMGKRGRALVEERYTWRAICAKMAEEYERLELRD